jgi:hypothetical protein
MTARRARVNAKVNTTIMQPTNKTEKTVAKERFMTAQEMQERLLSINKQLKTIATCVNVQDEHAQLAQINLRLEQLVLLRMLAAFGK